MKYKLRQEINKEYLYQGYCGEKLHIVRAMNYVEHVTNAQKQKLYTLQKS